MKKQTIVEVISALLILLFVYTSLSKIFNSDTFMASLKESPFIGSSRASIALWAVPGVELLISLLLFIPRTRLYGLYSSFLLMAFFTLYVGYMLVFVPDRPCSCGGVIENMTWTQHLFFNFFFTLLAFAAIRLMKKKKINNDENSHTVVFT